MRLLLPNRDHEKRFWCSTNVTTDGFHTWGSRMWGYCARNRACLKDYSVEETKIKDYLAYTFGTDCKFKFVFFLRWHQTLYVYLERIALFLIKNCRYFII